VLVRTMPRVIVISIMTQTIREDNYDVIQPVKIVYTKPPQKIAIQNLMMYAVQLPIIDKMEPDFSKAWYCWFYALYHAHKDKKALREVVDMTQELRDFEVRDAGFRQFCELFGRAAADPETYNEYMRWVENLMYEDDIRQTAREDGIEEGIEVGIERGREEGKAEERNLIAKNLLSLNMSIDQVVKATGLTSEEVEGLLAAD